jgi:U3 small nucleolar RNA-associated protein 15
LVLHWDGVGDGDEGEDEDEDKDKNPTNKPQDGDRTTQTQTLLTTLTHRSALRTALSHRTAMPATGPGSLQPILRWCIKHISDYRTTRLVVDVSLQILDLYGKDLGKGEKSEDVDMLVENLHRRVKVVLDASQMSVGVLGMLGMLEAGGRAFGGV